MQSRTHTTTTTQDQSEETDVTNNAVREKSPPFFTLTRFYQSRGQVARAAGELIKRPAATARACVCVCVWESAKTSHEEKEN